MNSIEDCAEVTLTIESKDGGPNKIESLRAIRREVIHTQIATIADQPTREEQSGSIVLSRDFNKGALKPEITIKSRRLAVRRLPNQLSSQSSHRHANSRAINTSL